MPGDRGSEAAKPPGMHRTKVALSRPVDIGVSMRPDILEHKRRDGRRADGRYCFWQFHRPVDVCVRRLWVASGGRWRGYFVVEIMEPWDGDTMEIQFYSDSWREQDGGPRPPFQGFTYKVPGAS